eukprot:m.152599 g.152599  ORF g.152599 m.152599 type:complete len:167 (+) comp16217_c2_seq2:85-585(+)
MSLIFIFLTRSFTIYRLLFPLFLSVASPLLPFSLTLFLFFFLSIPSSVFSSFFLSLPSSPLPSLPSLSSLPVFHVVATQPREMEYKLHLQVPFASEEQAQIAYNTLAVDKEPKPHVCQRSMEVQGSTLNVTFEAAELRVLRVASSWFLEMLQLTTETIEGFSLPSS